MNINYCHRNSISYVDIYNKSQIEKFLDTGVVIQKVSYIDMYCSLFVLLTLGSNKDIVRTRYVCWKWSHAVLLWRHKLSFIKCWLHLRLVYFKEVLISAHTAIDVYRYKIFEIRLLLYLDKKSWYSVFYMHQIILQNQRWNLFHSSL